MKSYFFHISNGTSLSPDRIGLVLPDLPAAVGNATEALLTLQASRDHAREDWSRWTMEVRDEHDTEMVQLPLAKLIESAAPRARCCIGDRKVSHNVTSRKRLGRTALAGAVDLLETTLGAGAERTRLGRSGRGSGFGASGKIVVQIA